LVRPPLQDRAPAPPRKENIGNTISQLLGTFSITVGLIVSTHCHTRLCLVQQPFTIRGSYSCLANHWRQTACALSGEVVAVAGDFASWSFLLAGVAAGLTAVSYLVLSADEAGEAWYVTQAFGKLVNAHGGPVGASSVKGIFTVWFTLPDQANTIGDPAQSHKRKQSLQTL